MAATHVWPSDIDQPLSVDLLDLDWGGPVGDRHHGETMSSDTRQSSVFPRGTTIRNHRQLSLVDIAELTQIADALGIPRIDPGTIAETVAYALALPENAVVAEILINSRLEPMF